MFLSRVTGISGNFVGLIKGAKCPFDFEFLTWDFPEALKRERVSSCPQADTDASRDVLLHHPGRKTISWTGLPGKDSPSQSGMWRVGPGGGHVVTSSHVENKAEGAWVRGAPCLWALSGGRRASGSDKIADGDCGPRGPHFGRLVSISGEASPVLHCSAKPIQQS